MKSTTISKLFIFAIISVFIWSCSKPTSDKTYDDVVSLTKDLSKDLNFISQKDFKLLIDKKEANYNLLDCREKISYDSATIIGAVNVPRGQVEFLVGNAIQNRHIRLYVFSDSEAKSILTATALKLIKYPKVVVIKGNWHQWKTNYPDDVQLEPGGGQTEAAEPAEEESGCGG